MLSFQDAMSGSGHATAAHVAGADETFGFQASAEPHVVIFSAGETKTYVFRIESGAVEVEWFLGDGASGCVERLGPGQIFGVGFLDHYIANAVVVEPSRISCWRREDLNPRSRIRERETIETRREFEYRKALVLSGRSKEVSRRIAGFLCLAAQSNARAGQDPCVIHEAVDPAALASLLQIDVDPLARGLVAHQLLDLVSLEGCRSLRICDLATLSAFAHSSARERDENAAVRAA